MEWQDEHLMFSNLKENHEKLLIAREIDKIWKPVVMLDDVKQHTR